MFSEHEQSLDDLREMLQNQRKTEDFLKDKIDILVESACKVQNSFNINFERHEMALNPLPDPCDGSEVSKNANFDFQHIDFFTQQSKEINQGNFLNFGKINDNPNFSGAVFH